MTVRKAAQGPSRWLAAACGMLLAMTGYAAEQSRDAVYATLADRFGLTAAERNTLAGGLETARALQSTADDGVAAIGAIWIDARPSTYLDWAESFADFERGSSVQGARKLGEPPALEDFSTLTLSRDELAELQRCRVGACAVQLDAGSIRQVAAIDWARRDAHEQATDIVRRFMLNVALEYRRHGNAGLPHYHDARRATDVEANALALLAEEEASGRMPPPFVALLRGYPAAPVPPGATSYLSWMTNTFGLKPTTRLNHTMVYRPQSNGVMGIIATRQLYATHYFHGALETRYILGNPAWDDRFVLVMVTRTRSDGLTGVSGALMGGTIRRRAIHSLRTYLRFTKDTVEQRQRQGWSQRPR